MPYKLLQPYRLVLGSSALFSLLFCLLLASSVYIANLFMPAEATLMVRLPRFALACLLASFPAILFFRITISDFRFYHFFLLIIEVPLFLILSSGITALSARILAWPTGALSVDPFGLGALILVVGMIPVGVFVTAIVYSAYVRQTRSNPDARADKHLLHAASGSERRAERRD
ncbi:MAG: hypothetical protein JNM27_09615 [Leptospirales bacterium]|nr:hypothetical protein [Leptospirales bacterium]